MLWGHAAWFFGSSLLVWLIFRKSLLLLVATAGAFALLHSLQFDQNAGRLLAKSVGERRVLLQAEGWIASIPIERTEDARGHSGSTFEINATKTNIPGVEQPSRLRLLVSWPDQSPKYGSLVRFSGTLTNVAPPRNPGEFDYAGWLSRRDIFSQVGVHSPRDAVVLQAGSDWSLVGFAAKTRSWMEERLSLDLKDDPEAAGVITAMVLGTTNDNLADLKIKLQQTGTLHLFAVSGLQVAMLGSIILFVLQTIRVPRRAAVFLTIPAILFYALITGWSASSVRAAIMTSLFLIAILLDRPSFTLNTLAASALVILSYDSNQLFNTGFQLSYSVVAAIIVLAGPVQYFCQRAGEPDPFLPRRLFTIWQIFRWRMVRLVSGTLGLTFAAWVGSMPLSAWYFHLFSPVALLANLIIVPVSFAILLLGVLSVGCSCTGNFLPVLFNNANWFVVQIMLWLVQLFASVPAGFLHLGARWMEFSREYHVTVLDLDAGASTVIETPHGCWLIDAGSSFGYQRIVRPYLTSRGINRLDGIFLTHGDSSHVGGVTEAMEDFGHPTVYIPQADADGIVFRRLNVNNSARGLKTDDQMQLDGEASLRILYPNAVSDRGRADDKALVMRFLAFGKSILLTSDSGLATEVELLQQPGLKSHILVMGRNRGDLTGSDDFLSRVNAACIICSAATFPSSEEIPPGWSRHCDQSGAAFFPQNQTGAVEILINEDGCFCTGFLNRQRVSLPAR